MLQRLFAVLLLALLSACVYVPVVQEDTNSAAASCKTFTKDLSLESVELQGGNWNHGCNQNQECLNALLATATVVTAGSAIISGSIVLTGKTIHWLEYQGRCNDGYLHQTKQLFLDALDHLSPSSSKSPP